MNRHLLPWKQDEEDDFEPDKEEILRFRNILEIILLVIALVIWLRSCCRDLHIIT